MFLAVNLSDEDASSEDESEKQAKEEAALEEALLEQAVEEQAAVEREQNQVEVEVETEAEVEQPEKAEKKAEKAVGAGQSTLNTVHLEALRHNLDAACLCRALSRESSAGRSDKWRRRTCRASTKVSDTGPQLLFTWCWLQ